MQKNNKDNNKPVADMDVDVERKAAYASSGMFFEALLEDDDDEQELCENRQNVDDDPVEVIASHDFDVHELAGIHVVQVISAECAKNGGVIVERLGESRVELLIPRNTKTGDLVSMPAKGRQELTVEIVVVAGGDHNEDEHKTFPWLSWIKGFLIVFLSLIWGFVLIFIH
ncbi:MAG: hypothetical protein methR_P2784 [Methyloprofundus sp.]|nr:MAG: hypothetical protein methR_P2784 [Methyloprofundus sp.]